MKRGFTLVELLMVIVLLGVIALIAVPTVNTMISGSREKAETEQINTIVNAGKKYMTKGDNSLHLPKNGTTPYCVSVAKLKEEGLLSDEVIKNPNSKSTKYDDTLNGAVKVQGVVKDGSVIGYTYTYTNGYSNTTSCS